jgi:hypothetical protein
MMATDLSLRMMRPLSISIPQQLPLQGFNEAFKALLENPEFMADGGTLAFGLRHVYLIDNLKSLKHGYNVLKGSEAVVYQSMRTLGVVRVLRRGILLAALVPPTGASRGDHGRLW